MSSRENEIISFVTSSARKFLDEPRVLLFGSRARGDSKPRSDFDFAIEWKKGHQDAPWARFVDDVEENAPTLLHIDLIDLSTLANPELRKRIYEEGKVVLS